MKKLIAAALAGAMLCSMTVMADPSYTTAAVVASPAVSAAVAAAQEAAAEQQMTVVEYTNNAVVEVPGLSDTLPIGQGGHVIINGAPSNFVFQLVKPTKAEVASANSMAATLGGKILSLVGTKSAVNKFNTARVNFYIKGVKTGQNVMVYQLVNGQWVALEVAEVRDDHVVVDMTSHGKLMFIEVPAV